MAKAKKTKKLKFENLPKQVQKVCLDAASVRYQRHYHPKNKHHKKHLIADLVLGGILLVVLLFTVYLLAFYRNSLIQKGVQLTIIPDQKTLISGDNAGFTLFIENHSGQNFSDARVEFPKHLPFTVTSVSPYRLDQTFADIGTVKDGETLSMKVNGYVLSGIDRDVLLSAILHVGKNYLGASEKFVSAALPVNDSTLDLSLDLPESLAANQEFAFALQYGNHSNATNLEHVTLLAKWPPGLEIIASDPPLAADADYWTIESIGSLEQGSISGKAILRTTTLQEAPITVEAFIAPNGAPLLQTIVQTELPVYYPNVEAEITASKGIVNLGDAVQYALKVFNREAFALSDLTIRVDLDQALFQTPSYERDNQGRYLIPFAATANPGEFLKSSFSVRLRNKVNPQLAFGSNDVSIRIAPELLYKGQNDQEIILPLTPAVTALNSDLTANAFARYFSAEGDQIGRGPIPPIVGETTKYWVFVHLDNRLHEMQEVTVSGRLPAGIDWTGRESVTTGEAIQFNEATRFFSWRPGTLPSYKTNFNDRTYGTAFEVAVSPSANQVGQIVSLVESLEVQGRDVQTGQVITVKLPSITTHLESDAYASDDGRVRI